MIFQDSSLIIEYQYLESWNTTCQFQVGSSPAGPETQDALAVVAKFQALLNESRRNVPTIQLQPFYNMIAAAIRSGRSKVRTWAVSDNSLHSYLVSVASVPAPTSSIISSADSVSESTGAVSPADPNLDEDSSPVSTSQESTTTPAQSHTSPTTSAHDVVTAIPVVVQGDFVAVKLHARNSVMIYLAEVKEIPENSTMYIHYMKRIGANTYVWPQPLDDSWEPVDAVIMKMNYPEPLNNRGHFSFDPSQIDQLQSKCELMKPFKFA